MKIAKIICVITDIMFAIAAGVLAILAVNVIRIMNVIARIRDIINSNVIGAFSCIIMAVCIFTVVLILIAITLQFVFVIRSLKSHVNLKTNSIAKTCVACIDTMVMISFVIETQKTYAYIYLIFCVVLLCLSITQFIFVRKVR